MVFPKSIREKVLIKCQRYCCWCGKYVGMDIELHHIIPKASGGADTEENCIPVCYMCHAELGRYNPKHPKGTKITESEIKAKRDLIYEEVLKKPILQSSEINEEIESDKILMKELKVDLEKYVQAFYEIDFNALPFDVIILDNMEQFNQKWENVFKQFKNRDIQITLNNLIQQIERLAASIEPNNTRVNLNGDLMLIKSQAEILSIRQNIANEVLRILEF